MVTIQCPHCEKDIELEDGLIGLFDCPYCEQQFSWETPSHSFMSTWFDLWFGLLIPSLTIFPGLPILLVIFDPQGLEALIYLFWPSHSPERIYNPIKAMGFSAMFTFQLFQPLS